MIFSPKRQDDPSYPEVPQSLRTDPVDAAAMRSLSEVPADTAPYVTPYLSLRARLSQIWINRWTILLALVLVKTVLLIAQLNTNIAQAKTKALSACTNVENIGSAMASMPHYLSVGVNELAATGIEAAVHGMVDALDLILEGVEGLILFFISFLVGTYVCLLTALVHGSLDVVAGVAADATQQFDSVANDVVGEIKSIAGSLESDINNFVNGIESSFLGSVLPKIPTVNFTQPMDELSHFKLDGKSFAASVEALNDKIPTFGELQNKTQSVISSPFTQVRQDINNTYGGYAFQTSVFPVAQKQQLTFCSDNDTLNNFFQDLFTLVAKARIAFIVVIAVLAIAAMIPMAWLEIHRWRVQRKHAKLIAKNQFDPMDVVYIASRPLTAGWGIKLSSPFKGKRRILVRWAFAYATSVPAIFVLSLAVAGFFSALCQYILLRVIQYEVPTLSQEIGTFSNEVVNALEHASTEWATDANGVIQGVNNDINQNVLGYVTNATIAVNNTLNTFLSEMNEGLKDAFQGTALLGPVSTVVQCVLTSKIESIESGLTWVHDNAHVSLPLFPNNTFSVGAQDSIGDNSNLTTFLSTPGTVTTDEVTGAVDDVTNWLYNNLIQDTLTSVGLLLVYIIVVLIGLLRTLAGMAAPERGRAEGGFRYTGDDRLPLSPSSSQRSSAEAAVGGAHQFGTSSNAEAYNATGASGEKGMGPVMGSSRSRQIPEFEPGYEPGDSRGFFGTKEKI